MSRRRMVNLLGPHAPWALGAAVVGLGSSLVLSSLLRLDRASFVLVHALMVGALLGAYLRRTRVDLAAEWRRRPIVGLVGGIAIGLVLVVGVAGQPSGARPRGLALAAAVVWYAGVYGLADAMLLTVIPVSAVRGAGGAAQGKWSGAGGIIAGLAASLLVTAVYHLGFDEFRGPGLVQPLIGNALMTAGYLVTRNPVVPLLSHVIMHGAAVMHGMEATVQLPPHY